MRSRTRLYLQIMPLLLGAFLLVQGCGEDNKYAKDLGCPSGSALGAGMDIIQVVSKDGSMTGVVYDSGSTSWPQWQIGAAPNTYSLSFDKTVSFYVTDQFANEKNDVCVEFTAEGIFWDKTFTTVLGVGRYVTKTNVNGVIDIYYSTSALFTSASGTPGSAGADVSYQNSIFARSGAALAGTWKLDITVEGCPDPSIIPGVCP